MQTIFLLRIHHFEHVLNCIHAADMWCSSLWWYHYAIHVHTGYLIQEPKAIVFFTERWQSWIPWKQTNDDKRVENKNENSIFVPRLFRYLA